MSVIKALFVIGPLLFGLAFLAPLTAQLIERFGWAAPLGLTPLQFGLILGGLLGLIATIRGRWV
jgi:ABC-type dipeptide/oligopeptide/nickel transport system permease component